jgi:hypothetical protein
MMPKDAVLMRQPIQRSKKTVESQKLLQKHLAAIRSLINSKEEQNIYVTKEGTMLRYGKKE